VLAHTPVEPLRAETIAAWRTGTVISTLAAFGGGAAAIANLRALRDAGARVLYGTDLGNLTDAGPSARELELLRAAGLTDAELTAAMTTAPIAYWKLALDDSYLVVDRDPRTDSRALLEPRAIWHRGRRLR
jgi:imidazolonepropionase-like amidohydrolase